MLAPPQAFKSVTKAAIALAAGGQFVRFITQGSMILFEIAPPADLDYDDPAQRVAIPALLHHTETLARQVREFNRQRGGTK
jgi:hypothetical protein